MTTDKTRCRGTRIASCIVFTALLVPNGFSREQDDSTSPPAVAERQTIACTLAFGNDIFLIEVEVKSAGIHISGLGLEEFTVYEDGEKQQIQLFADEVEPNVANPKIIYRLGYFSTPLKPGEEPRRIRIKVRKWKTNGYEVIYYPSWHIREYDH